MAKQDSKQQLAELQEVLRGIPEYFDVRPVRHERTIVGDTPWSGNATIDNVFLVGGSFPVSAGGLAYTVSQSSTPSSSITASQALKG